jgi:tRNA U34 5-carboxymethylaminomethyl modifying GTPase MnmE/TrmE
MMGWLRATATPEKSEYISHLMTMWATSELARSVTEELRRRVRTPSREETSFAKKFEEARISFGEHLSTLIERSATFEMNVSQLEALRARVLDERFRVAVLGEFKRGKSTLVNVLLGQPDFLPVAELPCTSSLIELRHGSSVDFESASFLSNDFQPGTRAEFLSNAGNAAHTSSKQGEGASLPDVKRWRVTLNSDFLRRTRFELVDTPGLGEDAARDEIAKSEAKRADAALIVLNAKQISSRQELDLIESVSSKLENIILVINQADLVRREAWPELQAHVVRKLQEQKIPFREDRIVFVSALRAEEALRKGQTDAWSRRLEELEKAIWDNLASHRGTLKAKALCDRIQMECETTRKLVEKKRKYKRNHLEDHRKHEILVNQAVRQQKEAKDAVEQAARKLRDHTKAHEVLWGSFLSNLDDIFQKTEEKKDCWTSERHSNWRRRAERPKSRRRPRWVIAISTHAPNDSFV